MVVAGINSSGAAWDRGPTVALDVEALGYQRGRRRGPLLLLRRRRRAVHRRGHPRPDRESPAHRLDAQLRAMQREQPGREVDLIAHSQGGIVVDWFLGPRVRSRRPGSAATRQRGHAVVAARGRAAGDRRRSRSASTTIGRAALDALDGVSSLPPPSSAAVQDLAEGSPLMRHLWDRGVPDHFDFTTIGATEDVVVPATQISVPGATETVAAVDGVNQHSAIVRAPDALRAVRAALEGRPPPCVGLFTALRAAVAPVVISRVEHTIGSGAAAVAGRSGRMSRTFVRAAVGGHVVAFGASAGPTRRPALAADPVVWRATMRGPWELAADAGGVVVVDQQLRRPRARPRRATSSGPRRSTASLPGRAGARPRASCSSAASAASPRSRVGDGIAPLAAAHARPDLRGRRRRRRRAGGRPGGTLTAFDAATGEIRWSVQLRRFALVGAARRPRDRRGRRVLARDRRARGAGLRPRRPARCAGRRPSARAPPRRSSHDGLVVLAVGDCHRHAWVEARDLATGARRWQTPVPASFEEAIEPAVDAPGRGGGRPLRRGHRCSTARPGGSAGSTTSPRRCSQTRVIAHRGRRVAFASYSGEVFVLARRDGQHRGPPRRRPARRATRSPCSRAPWRGPARLLAGAAAPRLGRPAASPSPDRACGHGSAASPGQRSMSAAPSRPPGTAPLRLLVNGRLRCAFDIHTPVPATVAHRRSSCSR